MGVNKVVYGDKTLVDLTNDTVTPDTLKEGITAHDKAGNLIKGVMPDYCNIPSNETPPADGNVWIDPNVKTGRYYTANEVNELIRGLQVQIDDLKSRL